MKRGGSGQQDNVARLTARGFGKAKATQALKDAGNNVEVALRILERQRDQQQQQQSRARGIDGARTSTSTTSAAIPSLNRTKPPPTSTLFASSSPAVEAMRRQRERLHPCVVQFGSCQYGQYCVLKDLPGDVCVQHFQGSCVYGSSCRHRHTIEGVDVRDYVWGASKDGDAEPVLRNGDSMYRVRAVDGMGSKVQMAEPIGDQADTHARADDGECDGGDVAHRRLAAPPLLASDFNRIRGSVPSYTEPMLSSPPYAFQGEAVEAEGSEEGDAAGCGATKTGPAALLVAHPTPFRDLVKGSAGPVQLPPPQRPLPSSSTTTSPPTTATARRARARHPCIAQYGSCKFGDACVHADRDADVCVHFLNRRCRYSADECRYRHETEAEYHAALLARTALPGSTADATGERKEPRHTDKPRSRLQGGPSRSASASGSGRDTSSDARAPSLALPSVEDLAALPEALRPVDHAVATHHGDGDGDHLSSASEMQVFLGLLEVFPNVEPAVVLQALRVSGGDPIRASDVIAHAGAVPTTAEVNDVAAALALAAAEETAAREAAVDDAAAAVALERHNALLTLISLFPGVDPVAVEAVLSQHHGAFADAYNVLFCAQENVARSAMWSGSTAAMTPADQLRVEKLCVMFPGLDADVVRSAYCAADRQWSRATAALNALTKELLSLDSVEAAPAKMAAAATVEWRPPHPATATTAVAGDDSSGAGGVQKTREETSAEVYSAYRAAENEILEFGDWRRVRERAYLMNTQRLRVLGQATAAFSSGDGRTARVLSSEGRRLGLEYNRLNRLAMLALEQERLRTDATSTLDLHGFHSTEVHDVLVRRVRVCQRHRIGHLRIVTGQGKHSRHGHQSLYPTVMEDLRTDAFLSAVVKVKSIKAGYIDVTVRLPNTES
uniref:Cycling sequence binding protein n=1 Tax=Leishmania donovani TaxID=5661 RepID=Q1KZX6_LEIDO|nr:cycling sequence binding protein [Leishmania donovani]